MISMTTSEGLGKLAFHYWTDFFQHGLVAFLSIFGASLPAILIVENISYLRPELLYIAIVSFSIHLTAMYVRDIRKDRYKPAKRKSINWKKMISIITIAVIYFTSALLITTYLAQFSGSINNLYFLPLILSLYYPIFDFKLTFKCRVSPAGIPVLLLLGGLQILGLRDNHSLSKTLDDFLHEPSGMVQD